MPDIVLELQKNVHNMNLNFTKSGDNIREGHGTSGLVLKTVNSANFGPQRKGRVNPTLLCYLDLIHSKDAVLISALKVALGEQSQFQELIWRVSQGNALGAKKHSPFLIWSGYISRLRLSSRAIS